MDARTRSLPRLSFSIVICCYTAERWELLVGAVESALAQQPAALEVIVCCDHNPELAARCHATWADRDAVRVIENRYPGRLGSARNTAVEIALGDIIAFLDDDAEAPTDWLQQISAAYADPSVQGVGGLPEPRYETQRPDWFPYEFDWVFGCGYRGLPTTRAATGRLIGACMTVRREAVLAVAGFHSDNHDDMDLSHRLLDRYGQTAVLFDPQIRISHYVTRQRVTWNYFWRRCFFVNRGKVLAVKDMGDAGNHDADRDFVRFMLLRAVPEYLMSPGDGGWGRFAACVAGVACAAAGNLVGRIMLPFTQPSSTRGLVTASQASGPAAVGKREGVGDGG